MVNDREGKVVEYDPLQNGDPVEAEFVAVTQYDHNGKVRRIGIRLNGKYMNVQADHVKL